MSTTMLQEAVRAAPVLDATVQIKVEIRMRKHRAVFNARDVLLRVAETCYLCEGRIAPGPAMKVTTRRVGKSQSERKIGIIASCHIGCGPILVQVLVRRLREGREPG